MGEGRTMQDAYRVIGSRVMHQGRKPVIRTTQELLSRDVKPAKRSLPTLALQST